MLRQVRHGAGSQFWYLYAMTFMDKDLMLAEARIASAKPIFTFSIYWLAYIKQFPTAGVQDQ